MNWKEFKEAIRILTSKAFWQHFTHYWSPKEIAKRIDNLTK